MAITQQGPNSQIDIDQFSTGVSRVFDTLQDPSIINVLGTPGKELRNRMGLLKEMVDGLNRPILKSFANDILSVMVSWLEDPKVLCCLIQGIWSAFLAASGNTDVGKFLKRNRVLADTDFGKFLDKMIVFIDFIIIFLTQDIKKLVFFIPDFIKEIMTAIMGAILLLIQETVFALRDSILGVIFEWIDTWNTNQVWSKCLPLKQMINILKKYINDYGMLAEIFQKIKGYVAGLRAKFAPLAATLTPNIKDLEFLYWLRDLLIKLKRAMLNFDLCVDYEFVASAGVQNINDGTHVGSTTANVDQLNDPNRNNLGDVTNQQGYTIGSDGTIFVDKDKVTNQNGAWVPKLSNSFLREFIHKEYNIPYDVIDNTITRGTAGDSIQGTDVTSNVANTIIDRCSNTPTADESVQWILNLRSRLS